MYWNWMDIQYDSNRVAQGIMSNLYIFFWNWFNSNYIWSSYTSSHTVFLFTRFSPFVLVGRRRVSWRLCCEQTCYSYRINQKSNFLLILSFNINHWTVLASVGSKWGAPDWVRNKQLNQSFSFLIRSICC